MQLVKTIAIVGVISLGVCLPSVRAQAQTLLTFGVCVEPATTFRSLSGENASAIIEERNASERDAFGTSMGLTLQATMSNHFVLGLGVQYTQVAYRTEWGPVIAQDPNSGYVRQYDQNSYKFLTLPVFTDIYLTNGNIRLYIRPDISFQFLTRTTTSTILDRSDRSRSYLRRSGGRGTVVPAATLSAGIGIGIAITLNDNFQLQAGPHFSHWITAIRLEDGDPVYMFPYALGLQLGVAYSPWQKTKVAEN